MAGFSSIAYGKGVSCLKFIYLSVIAALVGSTSVGNSELKGISWFENASFFKPDWFLCFVDHTMLKWIGISTPVLPDGEEQSIWDEAFGPRKSVKWIIHLRIIKMRLYVNEDQFLFKMRAGPGWPLGGLPDGDHSGGDARQCLEESYCMVLRWWRLKWLFQSLGFVEAPPDVSSTETLSAISSQSKLIWKCGQLKKINKWGEASTSKKKQQQNHTAVLSTLFFQLTCLPSFIPTCPPTSSSSLPNYVLVMSWDRIIIYRLCQETGVSELEISGGELRNHGSFKFTYNCVF